MIRNVHERVLDAPPTEIGTLIDGLAGAAPRYAINRPLRLDGKIDDDRFPDPSRPH
jgi:hypothetical protein